MTKQNYLIIWIIPSRFSIKDCRIASMIHSQHLDIKKEEPYVQLNVGIVLLIYCCMLRSVTRKTSILFRKFRISEHAQSNVVEYFSFSQQDLQYLHFY